LPVGVAIVARARRLSANAEAWVRGGTGVSAGRDGAPQWSRRHSITTALLIRVGIAMFAPISIATAWLLIDPQGRQLLKGEWPASSMPGHVSA